MLKKEVNSQTAQKILSTVDYLHGFHFFKSTGDYTGETATSLLSFSLELKTIDIQSIRYHFERGDFQKWMRTTLGDDELAERMDNLRRPASDEDLREELVKILQKRLSELRSLKVLS